MGKIICIYGLAASGKTTQAEKINREFGLFQFGMGDRLRDEIASGSALGQEINKYVSVGTLIPDDLMGEIIKNVSEKIRTTGLIFDGFPRMFSQVQMLEKIGGELGQEVDNFFYLKIKPETALARIAARAELSDRVDDKDADAIRNRFNIFEAESVLMLDYYRQKGKLVEIDGEKSIDEVYAEIKKYL
jgi:adenylate kinase